MEMLDYERILYAKSKSVETLQDNIIFNLGNHPTLQLLIKWQESASPGWFSTIHIYIFLKIHSYNLMHINE